MTSLPATSPAAPGVADQLIDEIIRACPAYRSGTRPIHAPGIGATGCFSATPVAKAFSRAPHFSGSPVRASIRFSNGTGDATQPDSLPEVRGMAVKFHGLDEEVDLIAMDLPMFMSRNVADFRDFLAASIPRYPKARKWWQTLVTLVRLDTPYPEAKPGTPTSDQSVFEYAAHYPDAAPMLAYLDSKFVPESYTKCCYHAVHAFTLIADDGSTRFARFHWEPASGVRSAAPGEAGNFLRGELGDRVVNERPEFVLRAQLAEQGDDPADPTRPWPVGRPRVVMGHLRITGVPDDQRHEAELLSFNPTRTGRGIGLSDDPTLLIRGEVYPRSYARRAQYAQAGGSAAPAGGSTTPAGGSTTPAGAAEPAAPANPGPANPAAPGQS